MNPIRPTTEGIWLKILTEDIHKFIGNVALGNGTQYRVGMFKTSRGVFFGIEGKGCYEFQNFVHAGYVMEKMGLKLEGDAEAIADFINTQLGHFDRPQGTYMPSFCGGTMLETE